MKKILSLLLALALLLAPVPAALAVGNGSALTALPIHWLKCESVYWWDFEAGLLLYEQDGRMGFLRTDGTALTEASFDNVGWQIVGGGIPVCRGGKWGVIDAETGAVTVDFLYATPQETVAPVGAQIVGNGSGLFAVARLDGTLLTPYKYWNYSGFSYGLAAVQTADGWGYVDDTGAEVIPCRYQCGGVEDFGSDGYAWVNSPDGYNIVDRTGREVFDTPKGKILAERPWRAGHGLWGFYGENGLVGFVEADTGTVVIAPRYRLGANPKGMQAGGVFNEAGYAAVLDENWREIAIDLTGQRADAALAAPDGAVSLEAHSGGLHCFYENGKQGYMDADETVVVPALFDYASDFWDGKALVSVDGVYGILSDPRILWFSDVADDAWYAPYVDYVAQNGIMLGTGNSMFEPNRELTEPECLTLALRLYDLQRGGDGVLPAAPGDWGWIVFTTADGTVTACGEGMLQWIVLGRGAVAPAIKLLTEEADAWGQGLDGTEMTMAFEDDIWTGTAAYTTFDKGIGYLYIQFFPGQEGPTQERWQDIQDAYYALGRWYRDSYWTTQQLGLTDDPAFAALYGLGSFGGSNDPDDFQTHYLTPKSSTRMKFACALAVAAGELETLNADVTVPDVPQDPTRFLPYQIDAVWALYAAGILTGVDGAGNFAPEKTLTRAEAAAMVARVLDPELRLKA